MPSNKPIIEVCAGLIWRDGKLLIAQRAEAQHQLRWEFPGGKIENGETTQEALRRELEEELGIEAIIGDHFLSNDYELENKTIRLITHQVKDFINPPQPLVHKDLKWLDLSELKDFDFLPADRPIVKKIQALKRVN